MQIEHNKVDVPDSKPKFIKIERNKETYTPHLESGSNIEVVPKSMEHLAKKEEVKPQKLNKPKRFWNVIKEINLLFTNVVVFNIILTAIIILLGGYIILMVLNLSTWFSVVLPLAYISFNVFKYRQNNKYLKVENKFPELNERIRTAVDNIYTENEVVDELRNEVASKVRNVDYGSFFKEKRTSWSIFIIIFLCFGIIFLANYDVNYKLDFERIFGFVEGQGGNQTGLMSDIISATLHGGEDDIYGDEFLAELGDDELTIQINQVGYEINMDDVKEPEYKDFESSLFPEDVGLEEAEVYDKNILKEHQELVKNYFKKMSES